MNMKQGRSWDMTQHPPMPRPKDDDGYFEEMSKMVFRAGLNWSVIEKKWPDIKPLAPSKSFVDLPTPAKKRKILSEHGLNQERKVLRCMIPKSLKRWE